MKKQQNDQKFEVRTEGYSSGGPMKEEIITFTILWDLPNDSRMSHHIQRKVHHWLLSYWAVYRYFSAAGGTDCTRLSGDPPSSQGISWGWRQQERYVKLKLQKTASFTVVKSLQVPPERTHLHPVHCLDTSEELCG